MGTTAERRITCYLAGGFHEYTDENGKRWDDWRDKVKDEVSEIDFRDPRTDVDQTCIASAVSGDISLATSCDITFVYDAGPLSSGRVAEATAAAVNKKKVILCMGTTSSEQLLIGLSKRVCVGLETGIQYLKALAEVGLEQEVKAAYRLIWERKDL